jgi:hypothetical protein
MDDATHGKTFAISGRTEGQRQEINIKNSFPNHSYTNCNGSYRLYIIQHIHAGFQKERN